MPTPKEFSRVLKESGKALFDQARTGFTQTSRTLVRQSDVLLEYFKSQEFKDDLDSYIINVSSFQFIGQKPEKPSIDIPTSVKEKIHLASQQTGAFVTTASTALGIALRPITGINGYVIGTAAGVLVILLIAGEIIVHRIKSEKLSKSMDITDLVEVR
jgi:hypothetical protein